MKHILIHAFILFFISFPVLAFAENISCDALFLDLSSDQPVQGFITGIKMNDQFIALETSDNGKEYIYQIDLLASKKSERTYIGKIGSLPIDQTPMDQQVSVMLNKPEEKDKNLDGVLTDTHLDTYVLKNCREKRNALN